ncbi:MAG: hypothetical protein ACYS7Y_30155, partial [Planctomycetota bacterium]
MYAPDGSYANQLVRIEDMTDLDGNGTYHVELSEYDAAANTDATATGDTPVGSGANPFDTSTPPDEPTAATQIFSEYGPLENMNLTSDRDDLTGYSTISEITPTYSASNDETTLTVDFITNQFISDAITIPPTADYLLISCVSKPTDGRWFIQYRTNLGIEWSRYVGDSTSLYSRLVDIVPVNSSASTHSISIRHQGDVGDVAIFKRVYAIPLSAAMRAGFVEEWTWTEDASADSSVAAYELGFWNSGGRWIAVASAPVGTERLRFRLADIISLQQFLASDENYYFQMRARGYNGVYADFPTPTQAFSELPIDQMHNIAATAEDSSGSSVNLIKTNTDDEVEVGDTSNDMQLNASAIIDANGRV